MRALHRQGALRPGAVASQHWTRGDGTPAGDIVTIAGEHGDRVTLAYATRRGEHDAWTQQREHVRLERTQCNYGGKRVWFTCPGCGSRRAVLFSADDLFRCRACHDLAYTSTRQDDIDRNTNRIRALQGRLKALPACDPWYVPGKPPGMHRRTYARVESELRVAIAQRNALYGAKCEELIRRFHRR